MNATKNATKQVHTKQIEQEKFVEFMTGGNSIFTLKSVKTGTRFTYKVVAGEQEPVFFVKVLTGSDNTADYTEMAIISAKDGKFPEMRRRANSRISADAPAYKALEFVFFNCLVKAHMNNLEIWHEGRCCRCGRRLTVPESIESGIGPECATKVLNYKIH